MRTVLVTNHPAPYRQMLYGELARRFDDLVVLYEAREASARGWGVSIGGDYEHAIATNRPIEDVSQVTRARAAVAALRRLNPDRVVVTGFGAAALGTRVWCAANRKPWIGLSGATAWADREVDGAQRRLRRELVKSAAGWIAYGAEARRYLIELGADPDRVAAANNPFGIAPAGSPRTAGDGARRIGFAGQLHWRKAWWIPLKAAAIAAQRGTADLSVEYLGDGPGRGLLHQLTAELPDPPAIHTPNLTPDRVHEFYDRIDVLVVPSLSDQWPIVASEAAARGVPAICTTEDVSGLPDEMVSGGRVRPGSVHGVVRLLTELHEPGGYERALARVPAARAAADPTAVADRWHAHLERIS